MSKHRDEEYTKLLNTQFWRRLRLSVLLAHPLCAECQRAGRITGATEVHHIRPVERGADSREKKMLAYDVDNLLPLCHACHVEIHKRSGKNSKEENMQRQKEKARRITDTFFSGKTPGGIFSTGGGGC